MSLNKSGKYLGKEDGPSNDKFSIFSLDSTFLPDFFAAQSENGDRFSVKNQNQLNLSSTNTKNNFQNFFRKIGELKNFYCEQDFTFFYNLSWVFQTQL